MENEVRYCTDEDGARIAYCVAGEAHLPPLEDAVRLYQVRWQAEGSP